MQTRQAIDTHRKLRMSLTHLCDDQLVEIIQRLDHYHTAAFNELAERYRPLIYRRSRLRLGDHADADDVTQIILKRVYEKIHLYRGDARFSSWLKRVIDTQCTNYYHAQKRHHQMHESCDGVDDSGDSSDHHRQLETIDVVNQVLKKMNVEQNEILRLRFYLELSLKQIAENLGLSLSAAKARLYRSLEKFQQLYQRLYKYTLDLTVL